MRYEHVITIGDHGLCCIYKFMYTTAILSGLNDIGYEDRWCYHTKEAALEALLDWAAHPEQAEPEGWHRHPDSGRRRPDGDKKLEYIAR